MSQFSYADIPDTVRTKAYFPLGRHTWEMYKKIGLSAYEDANAKLGDILYPTFKRRLDESIMVAKKTIEGKQEEPEKTFSYMLFPPVGGIRADLQQGTMKLLYGDSCDTTFLVADDISSEVKILLNAHLEDGIPVDWWVAGPDDDLMERRHLKYGFKIRDAPKKIKDMTKMGLSLIEVLKDIRNERAPQWGLATYQVCTLWTSGMLNAIGEPSNYEAMAFIHDGINAKKLGLPDYYHCYCPWPPLIHTLVLTGRNGWINKLCGLSTESHMVIQPIEQESLDLLRREFPDIIDYWTTTQWIEKGVPTPAMTLGCILPDLKKKETYQKEEFEFIFPEGNRVFSNNLGISIEEITNGAYLDVTPDTPLNEPIDTSKIISKGWGISTKFVR
ncbi:MAG TPA: hypothetical protein VMV49_02525 [Candidatus Deferrimicrobium sp.]|nr:hypothetical protein [Candidatus Deferrimicrobium sp.]